MIDKFKKIFVVVAHPDDDILGCGGTIANLIKQKKKLKVVFIAEGTSCRFTNKKNLKIKLIKKLK